MTETKQTLVVRIGLMGMADEGIGTASFVLSSGMSEEAMKSALETAPITIADVEVNDGYRVELRQIRKLTDYSPEQAEQLAAELIVAAGTAREMLAEHNRVDQERMEREPLAPWERDVIAGIPIDRHAFEIREDI